MRKILGLCVVFLMVPVGVQSNEGQPLSMKIALRNEVCSLRKPLVVEVSLENKSDQEVIFIKEQNDQKVNYQFFPVEKREETVVDPTSRHNYFVANSLSPGETYVFSKSIPIKFGETEFNHQCVKPNKNPSQSAVPCLKYKKDKERRFFAEIDKKTYVFVPNQTYKLRMHYPLNGEDYFYSIENDNMPFSNFGLERSDVYDQDVVSNEVRFQIVR